MVQSLSITTLPPNIDLESKLILKKLTKAHQALAELKGVTEAIPNHSILINTLSLQEAKDSSAIENIITTQDELYTSNALQKEFTTIAAKEVYCYALALQNGYETVRKTGLLTNRDILTIQKTLEKNKAGFRKLPGTTIKNMQSGEIIYTPPQNPQEIIHLMTYLEKFINDDNICTADPLVKMALIHHQFESIHPFYDGNGRTGRIVNILYLVKSGLLESPILYLSRYINQKKADYYRLLQSVRTENTWEEFILYMLEGVEQTSLQTTYLIRHIKNLMQLYKEKIREQLPKIYSQDLLNNLFKHPYTKIEFLCADLSIERKTAGKYLDNLVKIGILKKYKLGTNNFYLNEALCELLASHESRPFHQKQ